MSSGHDDPHFNQLSDISFQWRVRGGGLGGCVRDAGKSRGSQRARLMEISRNKYQTEIVIKTLRGEKVN